MGDRYYLQLICAKCKTKNPSDAVYNEDPLANAIYYAPTCGFMHFSCSHCNAINWINPNYTTTLIKNQKQLDKRYEEAGFESV